MLGTITKADLRLAEGEDSVDFIAKIANHLLFAEELAEGDRLLSSEASTFPGFQAERLS